MADSSLKKIEILYEDEYLIAFDKPSGIVTIPTPKEKNNTLVNRVNEQSASQDGMKFHPCHRLDKDTSGVILFAKGKKCQQLTMKLFHDQLVRKMYIAYVHGRMKNRQGVFTRSIMNHGYKNSAKGKPAKTTYHVLDYKKEFSIVEVIPETGRTNQIRIHFSEAGYPLVGERKFAVANRYPVKFRRVALHASKLEFPHPVTKKEIIINSRLPKDMEVFCARH